LTLFACSPSAELGREHTVAWPDDVAACDLHAAEICNGRDDDCDGMVDEDEVCTRPCQAVKLSPPCAIRGTGQAVCWDTVGLVPGRGASSTPVNLPPVTLSLSFPCGRDQLGQGWCMSSATYWDREPTLAQMQRSLRWMPHLGNTVAQIAATDGGPACVRWFDGRVACWRSMSQSPPDLTTPPSPMPELGTDVVQVTVTSTVGCALKRDGAAWCWADGEFSPITERAPRPVAFGAPVRRLASVAPQACAVRHDGVVVCLPQGRRKDGDQAPATAAPIPALGTDVQSVTAEWARTCALTGAGAVICVGAPLGTSDRVEEGETTPFTLPGLEQDVVELEGTCARLRHGRILCWEPNRTTLKTIDLCAGPESR
jgi:hypothetical protein